MRRTDRPAAQKPDRHLARQSSNNQLANREASEIHGSAHEIQSFRHGLRLEHLPEVRSSVIVDRPHFSLPMAPPDPFIGRTLELQTMRNLFGETTRLITVVGPGGVGKTRLALEFVQTIGAAFKDGVWFVDLSAINDVEHALTALTGAMRLQLREDQVRQGLSNFLRSREILLVLDNLEQIPNVSREVAGLLADAPSLKIVATSRQPLMIRGEQRYPLKALGLPDETSDPEAISSALAVELLVCRARAIRSDFKLTAQNTMAVAQLCRALDGLPLALELAAAHLDTMSPGSLLRHLHEHQDLPISRDRDRPARQRSLMASARWSYELLDAPDRFLFRQLGILTDDFGLEVIEALTCEERPDTLEALVRLVDRHLIEPNRSGAEMRFCIPETLRAFALEQLFRMGELDAAQALHAKFFVGFTEKASLHLHGAEGQVWLERLDHEARNLQTTLSWCFQGDAQLGVRLCLALGVYWTIRGDSNQGRDWLMRALEHAPEPSAVRAQLLNSLEDLAVIAGNIESAAAFAEEAASIWLLLERAQESFKGLTSLARAAWYRGAFDRAAQIFERALDLNRSPRYDTPHIRALIGLASIHLQSGSFERAAALLNESLQVARKQSDWYAAISILCDLGWLRARLDDPIQAAKLLLEGLELARSWQDTPHLVLILEHLALVATKQNLPELALRLHACCTAQIEVCGLRLEPARFAERDARLEALRVQVSAAVFQDAMREGAQLSLLDVERVWVSALEQAPALSASPKELRLRHVELSPRELEVLQYVATGETTKKIALMLGVSPSTVRFHVESIFRKLLCHTRAEAVRLASENGLLASIEPKSAIND